MIFQDYLNIKILKYDENIEIFSPLYLRVSTPRVRYIRACVYFCLLSIRCFNVVQPETRFHFQSANQIA
jgi:hypothetical protein